MSDVQLMRCFFPCSTLNSRTTTNTQERPLESPNRITRLIANRRERLMRLANLDGQPPEAKKNPTLPSLNSKSTATTTEPSTTNDGKSESLHEIEKNYATRSKSKANKTAVRNDVGFKKKYIRSRKSRIRRKQTNVKDDSDSDSDLNSSFNLNEKKEQNKTNAGTNRQVRMLPFFKFFYTSKNCF